MIISPLVLTKVDHLAKARSDPCRTMIIIRNCPGPRDAISVPKSASNPRDRAPSPEAYASLDFDLLTQSMSALAAQYRTNAVLTLDRRDFRAIPPLTPRTSFQLLPDDLQRFCPRRRSAHAAQQTELCSERRGTGVERLDRHGQKFGRSAFPGERAGTGASAPAL